MHLLMETPIWGADAAHETPILWGADVPVRGCMEIIVETPILWGAAHMDAIARTPIWGADAPVRGCMKIIVETPVCGVQLNLFVDAWKPLGTAVELNPHPIPKSQHASRQPHDNA